VGLKLNRLIEDLASTIRAVIHKVRTINIMERISILIPKLKFNGHILLMTKRLTPMDVIISIPVVSVHLFFIRRGLDMATTIINFNIEGGF
jgi:hypothetical protein